MKKTKSVEWMNKRVRLKVLTNLWINIFINKSVKKSIIRGKIEELDVYTKNAYFFYIYRSKKSVIKSNIRSKIGKVNI